MNQYSRAKTAKAEFQLTFRKYLVLAGITVFSTLGDSLLARGMKDLGGASLHNIPGLLLAILNPYVAVGIVLLLAFFASYMSALSWADLTYVLPATSLSYVLVAVIARIGFHEEISPTRWLGIALIAAGVGFVAAGPFTTDVRQAGAHSPGPQADDLRLNDE
jgi:drug/metabolite transporter (DMT)-like permease